MQVAILLLHHKLKDINPVTFEVETKQFTFKSLLRFEYNKKEAEMQGQQLPIISNCATTGHKLQGYTVASLFVADWMYSGNWTYTVLSRVRTMSGLYIVNKLSNDLNKYKTASEVEGMLHNLRERFDVEFFSDDIYDKLQQKNVEFSIYIWYLSTYQ